MATPPTEAEINRIAGPLLVGYLLNWGLFGVLSMQVYVYYLAFPRDSHRSKALVYTLFAFEAAQTFLFTSSAFRTFATGFGNPNVLDEVNTLWFTFPIMTGIGALTVQTFYAHRINGLSQSILIPGLIILLSLLQFGASIAMGVQTKQAGLFTIFMNDYSLLTTGIWEVASAACDLLIAICMTYYLLHPPSGKKQTQALVTRIIRYSIETGAATAVVAILTIILTFLPGRPAYYQTSVSVLGKVYANSMMVVFNSRIKIGVTNSTTSVTTHEVEIPNLGGTKTGTRSGRGTDTFQGHGGMGSNEAAEDTLSLSGEEKQQMHHEVEVDEVKPQTL